MQYAKTQKYTHAVFANGDVNIPLFNIPRNRLQNITESTNIRIKAQLGQPFSRRHIDGVLKLWCLKIGCATGGKGDSIWGV